MTSIKTGVTDADLFRQHRYSFVYSPMIKSGCFCRDSLHANSLHTTYRLYTCTGDEHQNTDLNPHPYPPRIICRSCSNAPPSTSPSPSHRRPRLSASRTPRPTAATNIACRAALNVGIRRARHASTTATIITAPIIRDDVRQRVSVAALAASTTTPTASPTLAITIAASFHLRSSLSLCPPAVVYWYAFSSSFSESSSVVNVVWRENAVSLRR